MISFTSSKGLEYILVCGGINSKFEAITETYLIEIKGHDYSRIIMPHMNKKRFGHNIIVKDGVIYAINGFE